MLNIIRALYTQFCNSLRAVYWFSTFRIDSQAKHERLSFCVQRSAGIENQNCFET